MFPSYDYVCSLPLAKECYLRIHVTYPGILNFAAFSDKDSSSDVRVPIIIIGVVIAVIVLASCGAVVGVLAIGVKAKRQVGMLVCPYCPCNYNRSVVDGKEGVSTEDNPAYGVNQLLKEVATPATDRSVVDGKESLCTEINPAYGVNQLPNEMPSSAAQEEPVYEGVYY